MTRRVVRFELEYDDGEVRRLVGDAANDHLERIDGALGFIQTRNPGSLDWWPELPWEIEREQEDRGS